MNYVCENTNKKFARSSWIFISQVEYRCSYVGRVYVEVIVTVTSRIETINYSICQSLPQYFLSSSYTFKIWSRTSFQWLIIQMFSFFLHYSLSWPKMNVYIPDKSTKFNIFNLMHILLFVFSHFLNILYRLLTYSVSILYNRRLACLITANTRILNQTFIIPLCLINFNTSRIQPISNSFQFHLLSVDICNGWNLLFTVSHTF